MFSIPNVVSVMGLYGARQGGESLQKNVVHFYLDLRLNLCLVVSHSQV